MRPQFSRMAQAALRSVRHNMPSSAASSSSIPQQFSIPGMPRTSLPQMSQFSSPKLGSMGSSPFSPRASMPAMPMPCPMPFAMQGLTNNAGLHTTAAGLETSDGEDSQDGSEVTQRPKRRNNPDNPPDRGGNEGFTSQDAAVLNQVLTQLVEEAVGKVEEGDVNAGIKVLQDGIAALEPTFAGHPGMGELYNQVAMLQLFQNQCDEAADSAQKSLDITRAHFGQSGVLTGIRMMRLGTARFGQSRLSDAYPLLTQAAQQLAPHEKVAGGNLGEAQFYVALCHLAAASTPDQVKDVQGQLMEALKTLKTVLTSDSMILSLCIAQHNRIVHQSVDKDFALAESLFKQHILLSEEVDPLSEHLAIACYQLGTMYYARDMLGDAMAMVRRASALLMQLFPEDHDLIFMCKHRMGMICAASGDHNAATSLLEQSHQHYIKVDAAQPLALEAQLGIELAKFRAVELRESGEHRKTAQQQSLDAMRKQLDALASSIGTDHMLVQGATRYFAQKSVMFNRA